MRLRLGSSFLCAAVAVGCGGGSKSTPGATAPATAVVGKSGGAVSSMDGNVGVTIPAGALGTDVMITVAPADAPASGAVGTVYEIGPTGTRFAMPVALKLHYDPAGLGGMPETSLRVATFAAGSWQLLPGAVVDTAAKTVSGLTMHLSPYAIVSASAGQTCAQIQGAPQCAPVTTAGGSGGPSTGGGTDPAAPGRPTGARPTARPGCARCQPAPPPRTPARPIRAPRWTAAPTAPTATPPLAAFRQVDRFASPSRVLAVLAPTAVVAAGRAGPQGPAALMEPPRPAGIPSRAGPAVPRRPPAPRRPPPARPSRAPSCRTASTGPPATRGPAVSTRAARSASPPARREAAQRAGRVRLLRAAPTAIPVRPTRAPRRNPAPILPTGTRPRAASRSERFPLPRADRARRSRA